MNVTETSPRNATEETEEKEDEEKNEKLPLFCHFSLTTQLSEWPQAPWNAAYKETELSACYGALDL